MKLGKTLLIGLATISLVACSGYGKEVSRKEFLEAANNVEENTFTKAVLTYSLVRKTTGYKELIGTPDENINLKGELKYTFENGDFRLDDGQKVPSELSDNLGSSLEMNIKNSLVDLPSENEASAKYYKFHTGPLGISFSASQTMKEGSQTGTTKMSGYIEFNKQGLVVKYEDSLSSDVSMKGDTKTYKVTTNEKTTYKIVYE